MLRQSRYVRADHTRSVFVRGDEAYLVSTTHNLLERADNRRLENIVGGFPGNWCRRELGEQSYSVSLTLCCNSFGEQEYVYDKYARKELHNV